MSTAAATHPTGARPGSGADPDAATGPIPAVNAPDQARHRARRGHRRPRFDDAVVAKIAAQVLDVRQVEITEAALHSPATPTRRLQ